MGSERLNLIFDADDTLWHSMPHFLEAQADFFACLQRAGFDDHPRMLAAIRAHELAIIAEIGYGRGPYISALRRAAEELLHPDRHARVHPEIDRIAAILLERHCELLPDVEPTLAELAQRHRLLLFTKGQPGEQLRKLERSGLRRYFSRVGIPLEKDCAAYERLLAQADLEPSRTVMIGNSPRSDINPAIRAGLRTAVFIPHTHTWDLEHEELIDDPRVIVLECFPHLGQLF